MPAPGLAAAVLSLLVALAGAAVLTARDGWGTAGASEVPVDLAVALAYPLAGLLVLVGPRSARRLGALLLAVGAASSATVLATAVATTATAATGAALVAAWVQSWTWVAGFTPLLTLLPLLYPDGQVLSARWRRAPAVAVAGTVLLTAGLALHREDLQGRVLLEDRWSADTAAVPLAVVGLAMLVPCAVAGVVSLVLRARRSTGLARRQVLVLGGAAAVLLAEGLVHNVLPEAVGRVSQPVAVVLLPLAVGVAATRHRLYDLDVAALRALVGVSLAACLAGAYLTAVGVLAAALPDGARSPPPWRPASPGSSSAAGGAAVPRRRPALLRRPRRPVRRARGLSARLRAGVAPEEVPLAVCSTVVEQLRLPGAALVLGDDRSRRRDGRRARRSGRAVRRCATAAVWWAGSWSRLRPGERALDARDRGLLEGLADQAAPALAALAADRATCSAAARPWSPRREEERRRLRRDLHDGVGAALAGARLQLESACELVDDPRAVRMLGAAGGAVAEAVGDVRRLTEDLRPPALDELGLARQPRALAERMATPALDVAGRRRGAAAAAGRGRGRLLPHRRRGAGQRRRHAGATRVVAAPRASTTGRCGSRCATTAAACRRGRRGRASGCSSMRQRAEELGGRLDVESSPARDDACEAVLPVEDR